jgi:hypothetical protein
MVWKHLASWCGNLHKAALGRHHGVTIAWSAILISDAPQAWARPHVIIESCISHCEQEPRISFPKLVASIICRCKRSFLTKYGPPHLHHQTMDDDSDDYGSEIELDDELLQILDAATRTTTAPPPPPSHPVANFSQTLHQDAELHHSSGSGSGVAVNVDTSAGAIVYPTLRRASSSSLYYDCAETRESSLIPSVCSG